MPKVLNQHHYKGLTPLWAIYVGRPTKWGNPYAIGKHGTREEVVAKYRNYLKSNITLTKAAKEELKGKDLVCWCAPKACHADILMEIANKDGE
jgi:hypothetical protein